MALLPDKTYTAYAVKVKEFLLTKHNPYGIPMPEIKITDLIGITVHNTPKISVSNTTMSEQYTRATYNGNMGDVRVHFYVDETEAWQNLPLDLTGWHAADGDGDGNRKTIAVECIMDGSGSATSKKAEENCARLVAYLLDKYKLKDTAIYSHNHWYSKKYCPAYILPHWDEFKKKCISYRIKELPVLDKDGYKKGDSTIGMLAVKELLLIAKQLNINTFGMNEDKTFGDGVLKAVNYLLGKWGYKQTGIAGENFIKRLKSEISKKIK